MRGTIPVVYRAPDEGAPTKAERRQTVSIARLLAGYAGLIALDIESLALYAGTVYGLVGSNGAGKSTLLRTLAGLQRPIRGAIDVCGERLYTAGLGLIDAVGWMPDNAPLRGNSSVRDTLSQSVERGAASQIDAICQRVGVARLLDRQCAELSLGQKQRVSLARLLLGRHSLLLLDEPTNGVDPEGRELLAILLRERARQGDTVIVSSHALRELEAFCDEFVLLDRGRLHGAGKPSEILSGTDAIRVRARWLVSRSVEAHESGAPSLQDATNRARRAIAKIEGATVVRADEDGLELSLPDRAEAHRAALRALMDDGLPLLSFEPQRSSLADAYARVAKER